MFRTKLARVLFLGTVLFAIGCNSCGDRPRLLSNDRPPLFSGRSTSVVVSAGDCCNGTVSGPYVPPISAPPPGTVLPQQPNIPRIDENGKPMPWDGKTTTRPGVTTGTSNSSPANGGLLAPSTPNGQN